MHISEPKDNPTLLNHVIKVYEFKQGPLEPIDILVLTVSNFKVDPTFHYKESIMC